MTTSLTHRAVNAAKWNAIGNAVRALLQFAVGIVLARLIGPEGFGIVAIAWIMIGFGGLFADAGFGVALVQAPTLTRQDIDFAFTVQLCIGIAFTALGVALAPLIATLFGQIDAGPIIQVMAAMFLLRAFGQTQTALMNRNLQYKTTQLINLASYAIGYFALGIPAAYLGFGAWSLVMAQLTQSALYSIAINLASPDHPRLQFRRGPAGLTRFGAWIVGTNMLNWSLNNLDTIVIGNAFGATALGLYNRSLVLVSTPMTMGVTAIQGVLMATISRAPGDRTKARRAYLAASQLILAVLAPVLITAAAVPETIVLGVYGDAWRAAVPLIPPLALAMFVHALMALVGPVLNARGRTSSEFYSQIATLGFALLVFYLTYSTSVPMIAWGVLAIYVFRLLLISAFLAVEIGLRLRDIGAILIYPTATTAIVLLAALLADHGLATANPTIKLLLVLAVSAVAYLAASAAFAAKLVNGDMGQAIAQGITLPRPIKRWLKI